MTADRNAAVPILKGRCLILTMKKNLFKLISSISELPAAAMTAFLPSLSFISLPAAAETLSIGGGLELNALMVAGIAAISLALFMLVIVIRTNSSKKEVLREKQEIAWREECYRTVVKNSDLIIFDLNVLDKTVETNENFDKFFGREFSYDDYFRPENCYGEDAGKFNALVNGIRSGHTVEETTLRIKQGSGHYKWCRLSLTALFDTDHRPVRVMGVIIGVDKETRALDRMREIARTDQLTGLLNKAAVEEDVRDAIAANIHKNGCAMLIIDIDDFKSANDTFGHAFGDKVLIATAAALSGAFRSTDIIGRFGGDEFMVFLKNIVAAEQLDRILQKVTAALGSVRADGDTDASFTCSIGAALDLTGEEIYEVLFARSDKALYEAKRTGKNTYIICA